MKTILALQPDARQIGYAVFEESRLIDWGSKHVASRPLCDRIEHVAIPVFCELIKRHKPDMIVLPKPADIFRTGRNPCLRAIQHEAARHSYTVASFARSDIRRSFKFVLNCECPNKYSIMQVLARWFPELQRILPKPRRRWEPQDYWTPIFDAISLAITYIHNDD
jgi:hypothetical protein